MFLAEIALFAFNFPPTGWAHCNGQILPISQNTALFALLGTYYGGDGKSTFALPNLMDRTPLHVGYSTGTGLSEHHIGEQGGEESVTLLVSEIPVHAHSVQAAIRTGGAATTASPIESYPAVAGTNLYSATSSGQAMSQLNADVRVSPAGSSLPHNNMQPYLTINFCIALQGVFPQRH